MRVWGLAVVIGTAISLNSASAQLSDLFGADDGSEATREWSNCGQGSTVGSTAGSYLGSMIDDGGQGGGAIGGVLGSIVGCAIVGALTPQDEQVITDAEVESVSTGKPVSKTWKTDDGEEMTYEVTDIRPIPEKRTATVTCSEVSGTLTSDNGGSADTNSVKCADLDGNAVDAGDVF